MKIVNTIKSIIEREGVVGLYNGNLTNCLRIAPTGAIVGLIYSRMIKVYIVFAII